MVDLNTHTVKHYNPTLDRWLVESEAEIVWTTDELTAAELAEGYKAYGWKAEVVAVADLGKVERVDQFNDNLALVKV